MALVTIERRQFPNTVFHYGLKLLVAFKRLQFKRFGIVEAEGHPQDPLKVFNRLHFRI